LPGGMLVVMQRIASALAFMHQRGVTHNDVKPENIFLHQIVEGDPRAKVTVKLGDLGLSEVSKDRANDFQQYAMSVLCMITKEKFGTRKFQSELVSDFVTDVARITGDDPTKASPDSVAAALAEIPGLLRKVWLQDDITMNEVSYSSWLENWDFFEGGPGTEEEVADATEEGQPPKQQEQQKEEAAGVEEEVVQAAGATEEGQPLKQQDKQQEQQKEEAAGVEEEVAQAAEPSSANPSANSGEAGGGSGSGAAAGERKGGEEEGKGEEKKAEKAREGGSST